MDKIIKTNSLLVVSDYNWLPDNIEESWITKYTHNYLVLDRFHRYKESEKIKWQENVGQNVYDIFDFIYKNYDNLPEICIFCRAAFLFPKDNGTPRYNREGIKMSNGNCSEEYFIKIVNNSEFTEIHDYRQDAHEMYKNHQNPASKIDEDGIGFLEINNSWFLSSHPSKHFSRTDDLFNEIFDDYTHLEYIRFSPGANYIIPKKNILKYNKEFYKSMKDYIGWDVITGEAHLFERAAYNIFNSNYKIKSKYKN
jgi:hypothetical protein